MRRERGQGGVRVFSNFSQDDIASGALFEQLRITDTEDRAAASLAAMLQNFYADDPLVNVLATPPARPPFPKVISAYGVGLPTPVAYEYRATKAGLGEGRAQAWAWERRRATYEGVGEAAPAASAADSAEQRTPAACGSEPAAAWKTENGVLSMQDDSDCGWDYLQARCYPPGQCKYAYRFGDIHLGQSCRLAKAEGESGGSPQLGEGRAAACKEGEEKSTESQWSSGTARQRPSGDNTVPYVSLAWAHTWLGGEVTSINTTALPQHVFLHPGATSSRYFLAAERPSAEADVHAQAPPPLLPHPQVSFFESVRRDTVHGETESSAVWELEGVGHREILGNGVFLRELVAELQHTIGEGEGGGGDDGVFASKTRRPPKTDEECDWDYTLASCKFLQYCTYTYKFGDVHLGQSCRLKS